VQCDFFIFINNQVFHHYRSGSLKGERLFYDSRQTLAVQGFVSGGAFAPKYEPLNGDAVWVRGGSEALISHRFSMYY